MLNGSVVGVWPTAATTMIPHSSAENRAVLVIAAEPLRHHLDVLLSTHGFTVYCAMTGAMASALLRVTPVDLILLHCTAENSYGGWETYTTLRDVTTTPVLMFANITAAHFGEAEAAPSNSAAATDLANYLAMVHYVSQMVFDPKDLRSAQMARMVN